MTDSEIIAIRDRHLPSQGEPFDCIAFARAIVARVEADAPKCRGRLHPGCEYLAACGTICNKCGQYLE